MCDEPVLGLAGNFLFCLVLELAGNGLCVVLVLELAANVLCVVTVLELAGQALTLSLTV